MSAEAATEVSKNDRYRIAAIAMAVFTFALFSREIALSMAAYKNFLDGLPDPIRWLEQPMRWTLLCCLGLWLSLRMGPKQWAAELGLATPPVLPLTMSFVACSPMLVVPALFGRLNPDFSPLQDVVYGAVIWPLGEEILFRGFAFAQLYRRCGMGFWPAAILVGVVFGGVHLGQAAVQDLPISGEIGVVAIISIGGVLFAWLYARWDNNLWAALGGHLFMNLWWSVFDLAESPLGGWLPNLLRAASVALLIVFTLQRPRLERWAGHVLPSDREA